jgi:serpin B
MLNFKAFLAAAVGGSSAAVVAVAADPSSAAQAINALGVEMHHRLAKGDDNLCLSPYSVQAALAMTYAGADGATREEMAKVLHYSKGDEIHASVAALNVSLTKAAQATVERAKEGKKYGGPSEPLILKVANRLFGEKTCEFKAPFIKMLEATYAAPLEKVDFRKNAAMERKRINGWVEGQTENRIRDLIPEDVLSPKTALVLVNAIYMKAPWAEPFQVEATQPEPFHVRGGDANPVPTMVRKDQYGYAKRDGYTAVTIPYIGGEVHFLVLVPDNVKGLAALEKQLTARTLSDCARLPARDVILHLPKFKQESASLSLADEFKAMGMKTAFDEPQGSANFERMAPRLPNDYLFISHIFHKTFIALDEKGTEAAAATAVVMTRATSALGEPPKPVEVKVDRPFLFAIQHTASGACLFLGRVTDPR